MLRLLIATLKVPCGQDLSARQRLSQTRMKPSMALSKCILHFEGLRKPLAGRQTLLARFVGMAGAVLLFLCTNIGYAMPDDREKLLELSADSADLNQQSHRGEYIGSVQLDQGTSHLRAASAITEGDKQNKLVRAIAKGNAKEQAHFWVLTAIDKPPLHAYADTIQYFPDKHLIVLSGNARVIQGDNSFSAPKINYDTLKQHVLSKNDGKERTVIIIHPEKKS